MSYRILPRRAPSSEGLQQTAQEVIEALHKSKTELAEEMEANLKQLKAVLQETQRITRQMDAVLKELGGQSDPYSDQENE